MNVLDRMRNGNMIEFLSEKKNVANEEVYDCGKQMGFQSFFFLFICKGRNEMATPNMQKVFR